MSKKNKKKSIHKRKLNKKRVILFFLFILILIFLIYRLFTIRITNIYITGNEYLSDQEIIDISGLKDYPTSIKNLSFNIKKKLEKNDFILSAHVYKKGIFNRVYIKVKENYPLFYYLPENKTVLYDGTKIKNKLLVPTVINKIPNTIYDKFLKKVESINKDILYRMSEIEYKPNDVDSERFFILMNDGNYVYLTIYKFLTINRYIDMIKTFDNKKGILYLDSGEYFDLFDDNLNKNLD